MWDTGDMISPNSSGTTRLSERPSRRSYKPLPHYHPFHPPEYPSHPNIHPLQGGREGTIHLYQLVEGGFVQVGEEFCALGVRLAGADDAGVAGDGVFNVGGALDDFIGDGFK